MIDLVLHTPDRQTLLIWGRTNPPGRPLVEVDEEGNNIIRQGLEWSWWAGTGKFKTREGTYDEDGNEVTPPSYASGLVVLLRIHSDFFEWDHIQDTPEDDTDVKEWERSRVAKYIKTNGTPGTMGGIPYYDLDGVKVMRLKDVNEFLASRNLPGHTFL